jgi:hypothetical protein
MGAGFSLAHGVGSQGLAEGEREGVRIMGKRKKYYLDRVLHLKSETKDRLGRGCVGRAVVSFRCEALYTRSQGGDFCSVGGGVQSGSRTFVVLYHK